MCACLTVYAQMPEEPIVVQVFIGDTVFTIHQSSTQTEMKTPWTVFSFSVGGKTTKYLWGKQSLQPLDNPTPFFRINPQDATLADYVVIKLIQKKNYRQLPEPLLRDNPYTPIDLANFAIEARDDDSFIIHPRERFASGEYILLNLNQEPHGELNDYYGYCFTIE